jgi:hypothetical protein
MHCFSKTTLAIAAFLVIGPAIAGQRTFVSTSGVNNPACSLGAPCRDFAAAIAATSAGGEVIVLDSGGYGPVTITQSVSIIAAPGVYAGISVFAGDGITVAAGVGDKVVLRGLSIIGLGGQNGIVATAADTLRIERCTIINMLSDGVRSDSVTSLHISDSLIAGNAGKGINHSSSALLEIDRTRIERNGTDGITAVNVRGVVVRDTMLVKQAHFAINLVQNFAGVTDAIIERVTVAENGTGGFNAFASGGGSAAVAITHCSFVDNGALVPGNGTIRVNSNLPSIAQASIEQTVVQRNAGDGVLAVGNGSTASVSNSTLVSNLGYALNNLSSSGTIYTRQNNTIRGNFSSELTSQNLGTITVLTGG